MDQAAAATFGLAFSLSGACTAPTPTGRRRMSHSSHDTPTVSVIANADDRILAIASRQDRASFSSLFLEFAPRIKAFLMRQGLSPGEAEELAQEAMLAVWRKAGLFDPARASASTWIFTIARNLHIDLLRKRRDPRSIPEPLELCDPGDEPHMQLAARQTESAVRAALSDLPTDQHDVVRLSFLEDRSHSEIAETLGIPIGTVKSRLRLAFAKLRQALEGRV